MSVAYRVVAFPERELEDGSFEPVPLRLATHAVPGDETYLAILRAAPSYEASVSFAEGTTSQTFGSISVWNIEGKRGRPLSQYQGLYFQGRRVEIWRSEIDSHGRISQAFQLAWVSTMDLPVRKRDHWEIPLAADQRLEAPVELDRYLGLGEVLELEPTSTLVLNDPPAMPESFSVGTWFRLGLGGLDTTIQRLFVSNDFDLFLVINLPTAPVRFRWGAITLSSPTGFTLQEDGLWHRLDVTYDHAAGETCLYFDGELINTVTGVQQTHAAPDTGHLAYNCSCDAIGWTLYNRALPPETVKARYRRPIDPETTDDTSLLYCWRSYDPAAQRVPNAVSNAGHADAFGVTPKYGDEGSREQAGLTRPRVFGSARGVPGTLVDAGRQIFEAAGPQDAVTRVLHRAFVLTDESYDALTPNAVRITGVVSPAMDQVRFDVDGVDIEFAALVNALAVTHGAFDSADIDAQAISQAYLQWRGARLDLYLPSVAETYLLGDILRRVGAGSGIIPMIGSDGRLTAVRPALDDEPVMTLRQGPDLLGGDDLGEVTPQLSRTILWGKNWAPQSHDELSPGADPAERAFATSEGGSAYDDGPGAETMAGRYPFAQHSPLIEGFTSSQELAERAISEQITGLWGPGIRRASLPLARLIDVAIGAPVLVHSEDLGTPPEGVTSQVVKIKSDSGAHGSIEVLGRFGA